MKPIKATLLITGAININNNVPFNTTIIDTKTRLIQYINSLKYSIIKYKTVDKIIFVENTAYEYDYNELFRLANEFNKQLEILTFNGTYKEIVSKGKGYGEGEVIKYAYENSRLLKDSSAFVKLTGRLIIKNLDDILKNTDDQRNYFMLPFISKIRKSNSIPTVLYKVNKKFYADHLLNAYQNVNDSQKIKLEHIFFKSISLTSIEYFKYYPIIKGNSGSSGIPYNEHSLLEMLKRKVAHRLSALTYSFLHK